jgi:hypothetical protein
MRRPIIQRATNLFAAWAYLLAIVLSSASHVHVHALGEASHGEASEHVSTGHCSAHDHDCDDHDSHHHAAPHAGEDHDAARPCHAPLADDDDCQICQFLGRPILAVTPFALVENSECVVPVRTVTAPRVQPIVVVATQARAPPSVAPAI